MILTDEDYDDMHHAIGGKGIKDAYRNNFCTEVDGPKSLRFEATGFWDKTRLINEGRDAIYVVNLTGIAALERWLAARADEGAGG